jgi:hypothetical protein
MNNSKKNADRSTWAIGGGVLLGLGVGFFFLKESPLAFVGSIIAGIGLGLMVTSIISRKMQD